LIRAPHSSASPDRLVGIVYVLAGGFFLVVGVAWVAFEVAVEGAGPVGTVVMTLVSVPFATIFVVAGTRKLMRVHRLSTMVDPVAGSLLVTGCSGAPDGRTMYAGCEIHGVLSAPGVPSTAVRHDGYVRVSRWPSPGLTLPVLVDRTVPQRFQIRWDQVPTGRQWAAQQAAQLAERMRAAGPTSSEQLRAVALEHGTPGRATVVQVRPGESTPDPGGRRFDLTVDLRMDSGDTMRGVEVPTWVPSHFADRVTPGRSVPVRAVMLGGGWVIAYQWDLG
jgi:hypothetical protein